MRERIPIAIAAAAVPYLPPHPLRCSCAAASSSSFTYELFFLCPRLPFLCRNSLSFNAGITEALCGYFCFPNNRRFLSMRISGGQSTVASGLRRTIGFRESPVPIISGAGKEPPIRRKFVFFFFFFLKFIWGLSNFLMELRSPSSTKRLSQIWL